MTVSRFLGFKKSYIYDVTMENKIFTRLCSYISSRLGVGTLGCTLVILVKAQLAEDTYRQILTETSSTNLLQKYSRLRPQ